MDLEWIFDRLAMEALFKHDKPEEHPHRRFANSFLLDRLIPIMQVLDLGSSLVYSDGDHVSEFDREELQEPVKRAGLDVVDAEYRFGLQRLWCRKS